LIKLKATVQSVVNIMELRQAKLPDRIAIYTRWFDSCKDTDGNVTRSAIARLFVKIGLARDFETASIQLDGRLKEHTDQRIITLGVFLRLFMRSIFT